MVCTARFAEQLEFSHLFSNQTSADTHFIWFGVNFDLLCRKVVSISTKFSVSRRPQVNNPLGVGYTPGFAVPVIAIGEHMNRTLVPSSSPYAPIIGFSRAVRVGNFISVGGTAPIDRDGNTVGEGDPAVQARQCLETIKAALEEAGSSMKDVIRTRMLLTRIEDWEQIAQVRGEYFKDIKPVDTVMEVSRFIKSEWLVEIEVDAVVANGDV